MCVRLPSPCWALRERTNTHTHMKLNERRRKGKIDQLLDDCEVRKRLVSRGACGIKVTVDTVVLLLCPPMNDCCLSSLLLLLLLLLCLSTTSCFHQDRKLAEALVGSREEQLAILQVNTRLVSSLVVFFCYSPFLLLQRACRRCMTKRQRADAFYLLY